MEGKDYGLIGSTFKQLSEETGKNHKRLARIAGLLAYI
jgi:hypothetical protein